MNSCLGLSGRDCGRQYGKQGRLGGSKQDHPDGRPKKDLPLWLNGAVLKTPKSNQNDTSLGF